MRAAGGGPATSTGDRAAAGANRRRRLFHRLDRRPSAKRWI